MFKLKKSFDSLICFFLFVLLCVSLSGCCGHSSGGNNLSPTNTTVIGNINVNKNEPVSFYGDGISLNALPNTFVDGTTIKLTKITGGNLLSALGMDGKDLERFLKEVL